MSIEATIPGTVGSVDVKLERGTGGRINITVSVHRTPEGITDDDYRAAGHAAHNQARAIFDELRDAYPEPGTPQADLTAKLQASLDAKAGAK